MRTTLLAALAIGMLASPVPIAGQVRAMPLAAPATSAAAAPADFILRVTSVCGVGGCARVLTRRVQHQPLGYVKRAVPLVIPRPSALQPVNASK